MKWIVAVLLSIASIGTAVDSEVVVIASTSTDLQPGQIIASTHRPHLPDGEAVTVITGEGKTITLTGPYEGEVAVTTEAGDSDLLSALSTLVGSGDSGSSSVGAIRGSAGSDVDDPWVFPVSAYGTN